MNNTIFRKKRKDKILITGIVEAKEFFPKQGFLDRSQLELKVQINGDSYWMLEKGNKADRLNSMIKTNDEISILTKEKYVSKTGYDNIFGNWIYKVYEYNIL